MPGMKNTGSWTLKCPYQTNYMCSIHEGQDSDFSSYGLTLKRVCKLCKEFANCEKTCFPNWATVEMELVRSGYMWGHTWRKQKGPNLKQRSLMTYLWMHYRGFTNPPCPWRTFQYPYCGTLSQWRCRQSGQRSSSPTAWQPCGSLPGQEGTCSWWEVTLSCGCSPHTEERPWSEAPHRHSSAFCRHFAVRVD